MGSEVAKGGGVDLPLEAVKRGDALAALADGVNRRADLMDELGVSRTTVHRIVRSLESLDVVAQVGHEFRLTALGNRVAAEVAEYRHRLEAAERLQPLLEPLGDAAATLDVVHFADATVTTMGRSNPYAPVQRFMDLLRASTSIRAFDTTTVAPVFVDDIRDEILGGMSVDVVYLPAVAEDIVHTYPEEVRDAMDTGLLTLSTSSDLPFGLAIFDDRIGVGGYDPETGMLRAFADTANPDARDWALDEFRRYRDAAAPFELSAAE